MANTKKELMSTYLRDSSKLKSALHDSSPIWVELSLKHGQQLFKKIFGNNFIKTIPQISIHVKAK